MNHFRRASGVFFGTGKWVGNMSTQDFDPRQPTEEVLLERMIRRLGYPSSAAVGDDIRRGIERAIEQGLERVRVRTLWKRTPLVSWRRGVLLAEGIRIRSPKWAALTRRMERPEFLLCFVLTLGGELENLISGMQQDSIFEAYLLDAVGSELAEGAADELERHFSSVLSAEGFQITARFSPGYCDWKLDEGQEAIFRFLVPESIGVRCTPIGMMIPRKSISGALVAARRIDRRFPCSFCAEKECPYRRDGQARRVDPRQI